MGTYIAGGSGFSILAAVLAGAGMLDVRPAFRETPYALQALVPYYKKADVNHVLVKVFIVRGGTETPLSDGTGPLQKDMASADFAVAIRFASLHRNTTYRVKAVAYKAAGSADGDQISLDASSSVEVALTDDEQPAFAEVPVQLLGAGFAGQATTSITVATGSVVASGSESFAIATPSPS